MRLEIPAKLPTWNAFYAGRHWTERVKLKDTWMTMTKDALGEEFVMFEKPVHITITAEFKRTPQDCDNMCVKLVIDYLKGKVIHDDNPEWVAGVTLVSRKSNRDYVTFELTEV